MKIMFITPAYRPSFYKGGKGGGEISNQILLEELSKRGSKVIVISMLSIIKKPVYRDGNIIIIQPNIISSIKGLNIFISMFLFKRKIHLLLKRIIPDIVISNTATIAYNDKKNNDGRSYNT